ncbi:GNAT family N-acetyltransferase [Aureimonas sp. SK2]|uniref:GNAT family N-acetyltransferase n=1 Tax=Aureimonas sp. SK2 TaxID=3015992 RepID=UPI0024445E2F|nr:GNAT family N-acetyltransferase [Aureimonas sp. SK2]
MQPSIQVQSFELTALDMRDVDVGLLNTLTLAVGWPHRREDLEFLIRAGRGIVAVDGIGRVFGSAMWFEQGDALVTVGLVVTTPRTQAKGTARWLMKQVFEQCGGKRLVLNSTRAAFRLYSSLDFETEARVFQYQGIVDACPPPLPPVEGEVTHLTNPPLDRLASLDVRAFGADRREMLALLAEKAEINGLERDGELIGYAICREFGQGHVIGPIVARSDGDAVHLAASHLRGLVGRFARIDTREPKGVFVDLLLQSGFKHYDTMTTMSRGGRFLNHQPGEPWVYGLAGHALS